ncbi:LOW QUALITY PROTEIN: thrombospondin type-1 domain-containing protein 7B [Bombina bombina]|uniref:LOW QUALITY PROTEIN: thrombospondin type-1 domain-containing protein 7B n=1 Tax=Bombina bombina TaxID=8345 RepID=UPI00235A6391|nr:LOW QUALITY PROTEIN: thrombospondin type-1 domain-containing protein 7B [Bombina bombina]
MGKTSDDARTHMANHRSAIRAAIKDQKSDQPVARHFLEAGHNPTDLCFVLIDHVPPLKRGGPWGQCMGTCGPGGTQSRSVLCIHDEGWITHHSDCNPKDRPESQRSCFKICAWHNELFQWEVTEWDMCMLVPYHSDTTARTSECVTAQHGLQHRKVNCVQKINQSIALDEICEHFTPQPPTEQACLVPCPRNCIVSEFSRWSTCSKSCSKSLQHRTRSVISPPLYGGSDCPNLTESRTCNIQISCPFGDEEYTYSLKLGPWSECKLPHLMEINLSGRSMLDFNSDSMERNAFRQEKYKFRHHSSTWDIEIGYQTRQVRCMRSDGKNALLSICAQESMPLTFQSCVMPKDCELMEWSPWSLCSKTCRSGDMVPGYRSRSRAVKHISIGTGRQCPELEEKEACNIGGYLLPPCPSFFWKLSEWKHCQIPILNDQSDSPRNHVALCGGGIQSREVFCAQNIAESGIETHKEGYRPVEQKFCTGPMPSTSQLCNIPCSIDCVLSPWSTWGPCIHENCLLPQGRKGFRLRRRNIIVEPTGTDGNCPHLEETIPCDDPVCYSWVVSGELHCVPENGECGHGKYQLNTTCKDVNGQTVTDSLCVDEPPIQLVCKVPCSQDCVISEWSGWSPCSHTCSNKNEEGKQRRTRSILAYPGEGGKSCPPSQSLHEYRSCNDQPCSTFYWEVSPWGPCLEATFALSLNATFSWSGEATCGVGIQNRKVSCVKNNVGQVTTKRCPELTRPETIQPCLLPCKKDCIVTLFSEWTSCPTSCQPGNATSLKQSRYRIIIQESVNGGQACPDTLYEERDCEEVPVCPIYRWQTHRWGRCVLVPESVTQGITGATETCSPGLQSRDVSCVSEEEHPVDVTLCLTLSGPMPSLVQQCEMPCKDDCTFTPWSKFAPCSSDCTSLRARRRALTGRSKKRDKCQNTEVFHLVETEMCPCKVFKSQPYGNWSDCIILDEKINIQLGTRSPGEIKDCGEGIRVQANACYDHTGRIVDPSFCSSSGYLEEPCNVPCPFDCKLSEWSSWSPCSSSCGTGVKIRSKWLKEKPYNGGKPCPKLDVKNQAQVYEAVPCYNECNQYSWVAEPWSACKLNTEEKLSNCGEGIQIRKVRCVNMSEDAEATDVSDTNCHHLEILPTQQNCSLSCPGKCVMSNWGSWSACSQFCDPSSRRMRRRFPLRVSSNGYVCPDDSQEELCILNHNCFHYQYNVTEWSTCQLSEKALCGEGIKTRLLVCIRSDGKPVEIFFCEQMELKKPTKMRIHCLVECPVNCQLSAWSSWSQCSQTCGAGGQMVRTQNIIIQSQGEGRPCPRNSANTKNCPVYPCYEWKIGEWSKCKIENGQCGDGFKFCNLTCMVHDGTLTDARTQVDTKFCGEIHPDGSHLKMPCHVPCPGDCHLTEWSYWSSCELSCIDGRSFETVGRQSRSRTFIIQSLENQESCPEQVIETRPCTGGKCFSYTWKASPWRDNKRIVWCQRSDGINVTGGCTIKSQPAAVRHCDPPCRKPFSYCLQTGACGCVQGYTAIMRSNGFLDYCVKVPGTENKKADVKTFAGKSKPINSKVPEIFKGWSIQPLDPDGRVKMWVYGVSIGSFLLIIFLILTSYLICKKPKEKMSQFPQQKPLTLAYDGDMDM